MGGGMGSLGKVIWFIGFFILMSAFLLASFSGRRGRGDGTVWYDYRRKAPSWVATIVMLIIAALVAWSTVYG